MIYIESHMIKESNHLLFQPTRRVGGTPASEITPVTIREILTPHLGHKKVAVMVLGDRFTSLLLSSNPIPVIRLIQFNLHNRRLGPCMCAKVKVTLLAQQLIDVLPFVRYSYLKNLPLKIQGQGHVQSQTWWSHLRPIMQSICLLFRLAAIGPFWLRYNKFQIWLWKFKIKITTKMNQNLIR